MTLIIIEYMSRLPFALKGPMVSSVMIIKKYRYVHAPTVKAPKMTIGNNVTKK